MRDAYLSGVGMIDFGKFPDRPLSMMAAEAALSAIKDAKVDRAAIDAAFVGTQWGGSMVGQRALTQICLPEIPVTNLENACSSGSTALHHAIAAVREGRYDCVLVIGADKLSHIKGALPRHQDDFDGQMGLSPPSLYAMRAQRYLHDYDATVEDLALVTVKNRKHAVSNSHALFRTEVSVEEVLQSRMIADPFTLLNCCSRSDGAAAVVVTSMELSGDANRSIKVLASDLCTGSYMPGFRDMTAPEISFRGAASAYSKASVTASDIDFAEVHDAFSIAEILYYEALSFCEKGEGAGILRDGDTTLGGRIPVNVSGGLMAKGHPPGATGTAQVVEAVTQLRGEAGERQVNGAEIGLTHCTGGGVSGLDHGACTIHILAK